MKIHPNHISQTKTRTAIQSSSGSLQGKARSLWAIDQTHSEIGFKVRHLMISNVRGEFKDFAVRVLTADDHFSFAEIAVWINPDSISTRDEKRDAHLKSASFFDVENYKAMTFTGRKFEKSNKPGKYILTGDLTIKDITKTIRLDVEYGGLREVPYGYMKAGFTINGKINRNDWGLTWNSALESGGMLIGDEIAINCDIQLIRPLRNPIITNS
jgi:polyisoprenoid-binding protein YceI